MVKLSGLQKYSITSKLSSGLQKPNIQAFATLKL
jgi:hypothetical protein